MLAFAIFCTQKHCEHLSITAIQWYDILQIRLVQQNYNQQAAANASCSPRAPANTSNVGIRLQEKGNLARRQRSREIMKHATTCKSLQREDRKNIIKSKRKMVSMCPETKAKFGPRSEAVPCTGQVSKQTSTKEKYSKCYK